MRVAIVSDIHGNRTAFDAVLADLRETAPDLVLHGGDLAHSGSQPCEVVDTVRELGWPGVLGNTDEMLFRPESLKEFAAETPSFQPMLSAIEEMAAATREKLGDGRLAWLRSLPIRRDLERLVLIHASPASIWRAPMPDASEVDLQSTYADLQQSMIVYAHIHRSYVRDAVGKTFINTGSVSLSHDGDPRAAYLLLDDGRPAIRRVAYDLNKEVAALSQSGLPHADWVGRSLVSGRFERP